MSEVPTLRIRSIGNGPVSESGEYVLYWMTAFRRVESNFSLQRAIHWSKDAKKAFDRLRSASLRLPVGQ